MYRSVPFDWAPSTAPRQPYALIPLGLAAHFCSLPILYPKFPRKVSHLIDPKQTIAKLLPPALLDRGAYQRSRDALCHEPDVVQRSRTVSLEARFADSLSIIYVVGSQEPP